VAVVVETTWLVVAGLVAICIPLVSFCLLNHLRLLWVVVALEVRQ